MNMYAIGLSNTQNYRCCGLDVLAMRSFLRRPDQKSKEGSRGLIIGHLMVGVDPIFQSFVVTSPIV